MVGTPLPASSQAVPAQREQGLLSLAFFRPFGFAFFFLFFLSPCFKEIQNEADERDF